METTAQKEHKWLQQLVGEWEGEGEGTMEPGKPPIEFRGTVSFRPLGDLWVVGEGEGTSASEGAEECGSGATLMTLGYDPQRGRFVGAFIASMMTHMWVYDGALGADGKEVTLDTEGPNMAAEGQLARFRDVLRIEDDDHHTLNSHALGEDGKWHQFMHARYRRKR